METTENIFSPENLKNKRSMAAVRAAAKLFLERSIDEVRMTDIAEESGIGVATLYRYFGTKTHITIAAMTYLWTELGGMFGGVFDSEVFLRQPGIKQVTDLMRMYLVMYDAHKDFMRLLSEFDLMLIRESVPQSELVDYERSIINFYPFFERAFHTGIADGTIREEVVPQAFYLTYAHAILELCKKLIQGELLPSDDFSHANAEIALLIEGAAYYLAKHPEDLIKADDTAGKAG